MECANELERIAKNDDGPWPIIVGQMNKSEEIPGLPLAGTPCRYCFNYRW